MPTRTDYVYLAGLLDGEGCIAMRQTKTAFVRVTVSIAMTHEPVVRWLHETFGGGFYRDRPRTERWKACYRWIIFDQEAADLLTQCRRYLKVKREQALLVGRIRSMIRVSAGKGYPVPPEKLARRIALVERCTELNRRGPAIAV